MKIIACRDHDRRLVDLERQVELLLTSMEKGLGVTIDLRNQIEGAKIPPSPDLSSLPDYFR